MTSTPIAASSTRPWYRHRSPWLLMLGPAAVVVAGVVTVWLAVKTDDGLVVEDYYKEGKAINRVLKREETAGAMGLAGVLRFEAAGHLLRVGLRAAPGVDLPGSIEVLFSHPTRAGLDQTVRLELGPDGDYVGAFSPPGEGSWHVLVEDVGGEWRMGGRWPAKAESAPLELVGGAAIIGPVREPIGLPPGIPPPSR